MSRPAYAGDKGLRTWGGYDLAHGEDGAVFVPFCRDNGHISGHISLPAVHKLLTFHGNSFAVHLMVNQMCY